MYNCYGERMKKLLTFISILISIVFGIISMLFILGISFRVYDINDYNNMMILIGNDFGFSLPKYLDYIYSINFVKCVISIFVLILLFLVIINIKNKFYRGLKYIGSAIILSSNSILIGILFFDKLIINFDENVVMMLKDNIFFNSLVKNSIIFLIIGLFMIVLYAVIDAICEKNNKIKFDDIEIIEENS